MSANPLDQFKIKALSDWGHFQLAGHDITFTNSALFMCLAVLISSAFMILGSRRKAIVPGRFQAAAEMVYETIANLVRDNAGEKARPYVPFIFTLFMLILFGNLLGMIPYGFTFTSHLIVTFTLAVMVFLLCVFIGFTKHGLKFFTLFVPKGLPMVIVPLIFVMELLSFCFRPISLSMRLFANMFAGHIALKIFASLIIVAGIYLGVFPFLITTVMIGFEIFIACLQAYIFVLLSSIYLHDSLYLH